MLIVPGTSGQQYLADLSAADKQFDPKKVFSQEVAKLFSLDDGFVGFLCGEQLINFQTYAVRINGCGAWLQFVRGETGKLRLKKAYFCKCPACPMCQWRRSVKWRAKFLTLLPQIQEKYQSHRWLFLTLTIRNCDLDDLRPTLRHLNGAFNRLSERSEFPMVGYVKSVEVTRAWDCYDQGTYLGRHGTTWVMKWEFKHRRQLSLQPTNEVHPHLHVMGLVSPSYFTGRAYVKQERWTELWQESLRVDYTPIVNIKAVKPKKNAQLLPQPDEFAANPSTDVSGMIQAICETLKYTVKEKDLIGIHCTDAEANAIWLKTITQQLYKTRKVEYRGVLKEIGKELEKAYNDDDLVHSEDEDEEADKTVQEELEFKWVKAIKKYVKIEPVIDEEEGNE